MLKRIFNYVDFYGVARTEEAYFYMNESELMELSLTPEGGFDTMLKRIIETHDGKTIIKTFREIIMKAYGKKSADGRQFIKSEELSTEFSQTPMFNALLMEIVMDSEKAAEFCSKIVPKSDSPVAVNARQAMAKVDMKKKVGSALPADFYAPISAPGYTEETMGEIPTTVEEVIGERPVEEEGVIQQDGVSAGRLFTHPIPTSQTTPEGMAPFTPYPLGSGTPPMTPPM